MAGFQSIAAAQDSVARVLNHYFGLQEPIPDKSTKAVLVRTDDLADTGRSTAISAPALSIFLYRVDLNATMRPPWSAVGSQDGRTHLPLDLHFLLTPWADNAEHEYLILGRAMQCLEDTPILSGPLLSPGGGWAAHEAVQVCLKELPIDEVMRIFDSLPLDYKLSVPYVARVVRVDGRVDMGDRPVTTLVTGIGPRGAIEDE